MWLSFSRIPVYRAYLTFKVLIRAIDPVYYQVIFPMRVTSFSSGMLYVTLFYQDTEETRRSVHSPVLVASITR